MTLKKNYIGLRDATGEEISEMIKLYRGEGRFIKHLTRRKDGSKLPFNGVLIIKR